MKNRKHSGLLHRYVHIFRETLFIWLHGTSGGEIAFKDDADDPPLFVRGSTIVDTLKNFRLFVLLSHAVCQRIQDFIDIIDRQRALDNRRSFADNIIQDRREISWGLLKARLLGGPSETICTHFFVSRSFPVHKADSVRIFHSKRY